MQEGGQSLELGTGTTPEAPERRVLLMNGAKPRTQTEIAAQFAAVWLTPQMDRLFTDPAGGRRRFLDRLVVAHEPTHARELAAYEAAAAQRQRLLGEGGDPAWLAGLEESMARHAVAATATRAALVAQLNAMLAAGAADPFPRVALSLDCAIAARLAGQPALALEEDLRALYADTRQADGFARSAGIGPHRSDFRIADADTGRAAAASSTGQQKAMLVGIVLGHAALIAATRGTPPLLLLDEPLVHLDAAHRQALFAALERLDLAAWLTGTDAEPFMGLHAAFYKLEDGFIKKT